MTHPNTLTLGGDLPTSRLGFGALQLRSAPAADRERSLAVARRAVELGVTFVDTADSYDYGANEELLAEALHPYRAGLIVATKAGQARPGGAWVPLGRPEYLRQQAELSLRRLRLDRIDLFQLHRVDPTVPLADQVGALAQLRDEGKIRHIGLSEVTVDQIERARAVAPIVSVQNRYHLTDRAADEVLAHCERHGIAFIPWLPVRRQAAGTDDALTRVSRELGVTPVQTALAWLLHRSPVMLPIPGTSQLAHLEQNVAAGSITLTPDQLARLNAAAPSRQPA